jgi:hypothetical protein
MDMYEDEEEGMRQEVEPHKTDRTCPVFKGPNGEDFKVPDCGVKGFGEFSHPAFADVRDLPCGKNKDKGGF